MKSTAIVCAIAAASLSLSSLSFAQGYNGRGPNGNGPRAEQQRDRDDARDRWDNRGQRDGRDGRDFGPRGYDKHRDARNDRFVGARGPQFHRGGHIPPEYRRNQYVVNNWRAYHLNAPPRGYHWVQVGADYALIAIATGIIANLVLN